MLPKLLSISYKVETNEEVCGKIQAAIAEYDELLTMAKKQKTKVVWPCLKRLCFSKDDAAGHGEWEMKKR